MAKTTTDADRKNMLGGIAIRSEEIGHSAEELVVCNSCERANAPGRASCLYCGAVLTSAFSSSDSISINLRRLENWENGHNVIIRAPQDAQAGAAIASLFSLRTEAAKALFVSNSVVPIARLESESDAKTAIEHMKSLGSDLGVISDIRLKMGKPNVRLRKLEFDNDRVTVTEFNTGERREFRRGEVVLMVAGTLFENRTDLVSKRKGRSEKILDECTTSSDDEVVDLYTDDQERGWRIMTRGFDFSGLGDEKAYTAQENLSRLRNRLNEYFPEARVSEDYREIVGPLSEVWPLEERIDFEGVKRIGVWRSGFGRSLRSSNFDQFQRFSRLQRIAV